MIGNCRANGQKGEEKDLEKFFEKISKNLLTKCFECDIIAKLAHTASDPSLEKGRKNFLKIFQKPIDKRFGK